MPDVVTFDPVNLRIVEIDTAGDNALSVQEIYSEWKAWLLADPTRMGHAPAMRYTGADPISDTQNLGTTFFLLNGWRIRPAEASHRLRLTGNLYNDPAVGSSVVPTLGSFTVLVEMSVSNLVDSVIVNSPDIQYSAFDGGVHVDLLSAYSGTTYPNGTPRQPLNNWIDALDVANARGFSAFHVTGDATIDSGLDYAGKVFYGESQTKSLLTLSGAALVSNCEFYDAEITGTLDGGAHLRGCVVSTLNYVDGFVEQCVLKGTITLGGDAHFLDCWSGIPGTPPVLDFDGSASALAMRNFNGDIVLRNKTGAEPVSIDLNSGQVTLESTVTNGTITIRGVGKVVDNSTGTAVVQIESLVRQETIIQIEKNTKLIVASVV